jgi:hypothetical protein
LFFWSKIAATVLILIAVSIFLINSNNNKNTFHADTLKTISNPNISSNNSYSSTDTAISNVAGLNPIDSIQLKHIATQSSLPKIQSEKTIEEKFSFVKNVPTPQIETKPFESSEFEQNLKLINIILSKTPTILKSKVLPHKPYFVTFDKPNILIETQMFYAQSHLIRSKTFDNQNTKGNAYGFQLNLLKSYKHWEFGLGLNYSRIKINGIHNWNKTSIFQDSILIKKRYTHEIKYHRFLDTSTLEQSSQYNNNFQYLQIPFTFAYKTNLSKNLGVYFAINGNLNYLLKGHYNINYQDNHDIDIVQSKNLNLQDKITLGLGYRFGLLYKINKAYEVNISQNNQIHFTGIKNNGSSYLPYYRGLSIGIRKYLNIDATN